MHCDTSGASAAGVWLHAAQLSAGRVAGLLRGEGDEVAAFTNRRWDMRVVCVVCGKIC
jgi:hypothetical protein